MINNKNLQFEVHHKIEDASKISLFFQCLKIVLSFFITLKIQIVLYPIQYLLLWSTILCLSSKLNQFYIADISMCFTCFAYMISSCLQTEEVGIMSYHLGTYVHTPLGVF